MLGCLLYGYIFYNKQSNKMKKQFLDNFSTQFPNQLNCSSIRINIDQPQEVDEPKQQKKNDFLTVGPRLKKYQQHDLVGFQMSLEISQNGQRCRELMRSKSAREFKFSNQQRLQKSKKLKEAASIRQNSLYNTTSFDEVTMNITNNTKNINVHNQTQQSISFDKNNSRTLKKPNELSRYKEAFTEDNISIHINQPQLKNQIKNTQELIASLKCSITQQQQPNKSYEQTSYQQPYFKIGSSKTLLPPQGSHPEKPPIKDYRRQIKKLTIDTNHSSHTNEQKLTLRDYIYLSKLSGKTREKSTQCQSPRSPTLKNTSISRTRRNGTLSNAEVMTELTKEVVKNIELIQGNMGLILQYVKSCKIEDDMSHKQMMNMYNLARLLREKMVAGNDELVLMLQQASKQ